MIYRRNAGKKFKKVFKQSDFDQDYFSGVRYWSDITTGNSKIRF